MKINLRSLVTGLFLLTQFAVPSFSQRDFSNVEVKATLVSGNIYMLEGSGGNIGVCAGEDGVLIVDDQFAGLAEKIEAALSQINSSPVTYVLNTHLHGDHTGGNPHFGAKKATIVAHDHVRQNLSANQEFDAAGLPAITFSDSATLHFNGETIRLLHYGPGHTDGDSIVKFENANVIHMGDLMFNGSFPYVDLGNGGNIDGYMAAVENALSYANADTKIIPGHGALASKADLEDGLRMIGVTSKIVRDGIDEGKTLDELKETGLPEEWKSFGEGFINEDRWIETIYNDTLHIGTSQSW